ncbi:MAG: c-type cytochrome [Steroidobacterales bacterium]
MSPTIRWMFAALAALAAPLAWSRGTAEAGATKTTTCLACHGANGNSVNPQWPSLAGQNAAYITAQLKYFHDKKRLDASGLMPPMAAPLSEQDIEDVAAYYASQTPAGLEADPSYWKAGEKLYRGGDRTRKVPACVACHGPVGRGNPAAGYPALRAQQSVYTIAQLTDYVAGSRYTKEADGGTAGGPNAEIMHTIASRLTQEDMRNLASYIQGMR